MTQRLFVALWPGPEVVDAVRRQLAPAQDAYGELRWQSPDRWHLTLAFLGDRGPDKETERLQRLEPPTVGPLRVSGSGRFGPVLWLGIEAGPWLAELAAEVRRVYDVRDRRFRAHVTVARSRSTPGQRQLAHAAADLSNVHSPTWSPSELVLVESTIGPAASYRVICASALTDDSP
jgi:2'-5' RNA ligase